MTSSKSLEGVTVAVTRPAKQAGPLCRLIEDHGGKAIAFPSLEILAAEQSQQITSLPERLHLFDMAIFISANAVEGAARLIGDELPASLKLVAVGSSTRKAVEQQWQRPVLCSDQGANSEALLATQELQQVKGRSIIIFRGQGGRELLADTLQQRGATVEYAEVYRRARPAGDLAALAQHQPAIDLITATSNESLQNLYDMASPEQRPWLLARQLIVISERAAQLAEQLGFQHPAIVSPESNDLGMIEAMLDWRKDKQNNNH